MLDETQIKGIVSSGEGYNAEFKVRLPSKVRDVSEEVCAFANAAGGIVLLGVDDNNIIHGIAIDNSKRSAIQDSLGEISPKLQCEFYFVMVDGKEVGVIEVPSGVSKPYILSGAIYVRQGPNSQKLTTAEEMRDFFQQSERIYFDEGPCVDANIQTDITPSTITTFRAEANLSKAIPDDQIFENLKLLTKDGYLKNGAALFFATDPERFFDKAVIRCIAFDGFDKRYIIDDKTMTGTLYQQYEKSMAWLKSKLNVRYDIEGAGGGPRIEIWEIPETAFKEAIINALSHRDYYDKGARITVELFEDRVEISNPGGLIGGITRSDFGRRSLSRNPLIFGLFERMRMVEQVGSGITRMRDLLAEADLTPPEFSTDGMFTVTFRRPFDFEKWLGKWKPGLTETRIKIIRGIHDNPEIKKADLEKLTGLSPTGIDKNLNALKELGLVEREGTRGGNWILHYIYPEA